MRKKYEKVWENCLKVIKDNITSQSFKTWFEPVKPVKLEKNILTIQVPSQFFYEWLEEHYINLLRKTIKSELGPDGRLEYSIIMDNRDRRAPYSIKYPTANKQATSNASVNMPIDINRGQSKEVPNPFIIPGLQKIKINSQLNENYSFDNFIEGECNRLARSAGFAIAENPGKTSFNPFLLFSKVGLGKTHLAHAIGLEVKDRFPDKTVLYVTSEQFTNQYVEAANNNNRNDFINFYQMIDVLIIDDIQFLANKEKTQEAFFHIFNHLHQNNKQLIITSDRPPVEMTNLNDRLLSRFKWGLSANLGRPNIRTRIQIINKKIYKDGIIEIPKNVIEYLAMSIDTNIRELEGAMISLMAQASLNKKDITMDMARSLIDNFVKHTKREISIDFIQKVVADYFGLTIVEIQSKTRKREIVQARQLAMFFSKKFTKSSLTTIGHELGKKDHATVLHACRTVNNLLDTDKQFRYSVEELEKRIQI
jgi:chromosomal replication initiator protein